MIFRIAPALALAAAALTATAVEPTPFQLSRWVRPVPRHSVLMEAGYYVWGGSVVEDGGRYHMFYSRWHTSPWTFADGWLFDSEICHAVADTPGGPFTPTGVVLGKRPDDAAMAFWDSQTQHNPHIRKFGGKFHLYYMASVDPGAAVWPGITQRNRIQRNQRIGVIVADTLQDLVTGNFARPSPPLITPLYSTSAATDRTTNPTDYASNRIVNNQTVIERPDGTFELICKSNWPQASSYGHGRWLANSPTGPFTEMAGPVFSDQGREDENHWFDAARNRYFLICKNFSNNGTEQLESAMTFRRPPPARLNLPRIPPTFPGWWFPDSLTRSSVPATCGSGKRPPAGCSSRRAPAWLRSTLPTPRPIRGARSIGSGAARETGCRIQRA